MFQKHLLFQIKSPETSPDSITVFISLNNTGNTADNVTVAFDLSGPGLRIDYGTITGNATYLDTQNHVGEVEFEWNIGTLNGE